MPKLPVCKGKEAAGLSILTVLLNCWAKVAKANNAVEK